MSGSANSYTDKLIASPQDANITRAKMTDSQVAEGILSLQLQSITCYPVAVKDDPRSIPAIQR